MNSGFTAEELQVKGKKFSEGFKFGLGICVNDGDREAGQEGQKGWSGWYTHSIVFGKNSEHTGWSSLRMKCSLSKPLVS